MSDDAVELTSSAGLAAAEAVASLLRASGIAAEVRSDSLGGEHGGLGFASGHRVVVPAALAAEATELLRSGEGRRPPDEPPDDLPSGSTHALWRRGVALMIVAPLLLVTALAFLGIVVSLFFF